MQPRVDLYGGIHKALRGRLFDLGVELDRCCFTRPSEVAIALAAYHRTMGFLREHHQHEDTFIEPELERCGIEIAAAVVLQHGKSDVARAELDTLVGAIEHGGDDRSAAGARLGACYRRFLIEYLQHMNHEETVVNEALWMRYSDPELAAIRGRLQGSIPPARFGEWLEIMLPALNLDERTAMLRGIQTGAPAPAFEAATAIATRVLGTAGWDAVRQQLGA